MLLAWVPWSISAANSKPPVKSQPAANSQLATKPAATSCFRAPWPGGRSTRPKYLCQISVCGVKWRGCLYQTNKYARRQYRYVVAKVPSSLQNRVHGLYIKRGFYLVRALAGLSRIASDNQASLQTLWAIATAILLEANLRSCKAFNSF